MVPFEFRPATRVVFGTGAVERLGRLAADLGAGRVLLVADNPQVEAGHVGAATGLLTSAGIEVLLFTGFEGQPGAATIESGRAFAAPLAIDTIVGIGDGTSLDVAKAVNFLLTNGGEISDYRGFGKAAKPLLPMIAVPTTTGTGSEALSYAVIPDAVALTTFACGASSSAFRIAVLDPALTLNTPAGVTVHAGFHAIGNAVEAAVSTRRTPLSDGFSHQAWRLLSAAYERVLSQPNDFEVRSSMQVGAFLAGMAVEQSTLGAADACAGPLTARYGITHGAALAILLP